ncbi:septal ring lytic transglycosylase RlpA family protein [Sorangium sp. So ce375]|uniref:septal ring lytic transglycosylase RlpA family protein n=1 Tax=Sorangium sp. So ce375 TaxID=3133306 RepID=UPI003F5BAD3B
MLAFLLLFFTPACSAHQPAAPRTGADAPIGLGVAPSSPPASPRHQAEDDDPDDGDSITTPTAPASARSAAKGTAIQRGRATYYADKFNGRRTASGERYNPRALTAAHRTLPFGALVDVVRRDGRRVRVRINDRGPFKRGRIIDLSRRAAERIGLIEDGITQVTLELIWKPERRPR